ncbi:Ail/Lom family outer membrane beta-barrel protein [Escherichia coli]|uniref:Ail/Lom family outer membrane beta-barrel protein n=1 Tax=Escherichia coli TaxID=562 RepID=UPI00388FA9DB
MTVATALASGVGAGVQFNPTESVTIDLAYEGFGSGGDGERMHLLLVSDTVSDNRRRFIFCKYCYDTQVHPPYGGEELHVWL